MKSPQFNEQEAKEERENYWLNNFKLNDRKYRLFAGIFVGEYAQNGS